MKTTQESIIAAVHQTLTDEVTRIVAEEAAAAAKRVEARVKDEAARIAAKVVGWTSHESMRNEIRITINIPPVNGRET